MSIKVPKEIINELKKYKRIFLQVPDCLKKNIFEIVKELESEGLEIIVDGTSIFGSCDIKDEEACRFNCKAIFHIGHTPHYKKINTKIPIIYWEYFYEPHEKELENIIKSNEESLKNYKKIGLVCSVQYIKYLNLIKKLLEKSNKEVFVEKCLYYDGQIVGCNICSAKKIERFVDCILVISSGTFHALWVSLNVKKDVILLDVDKKKILIEELKKLKEKFEKVMLWNYYKFLDSKKVCILTSWKKGQIFYDPFEVKKELEKMGKNVIIIAMDNIDPKQLKGLDVDFYVNIACPRIIDDFERFDKPILNWDIILKFYNSNTLN